MCIVNETIKNKTVFASVTLSEKITVFFHHYNRIDTHLYCVALDKWLKLTLFHGVDGSSILPCPTLK